MYATPQLRAETRKKRRRRTLILFYFFMFITVIAAAAALSLTVLFKIDDIQVTGTNRYAAQDIIKASGIREVNISGMNSLRHTAFQASVVFVDNDAHFAKCGKMKVNGSGAEFASARERKYRLAHAADYCAQKDN